MTEYTLSREASDYVEVRDAVACFGDEEFGLIDLQTDEGQTMMDNFCQLLHLLEKHKATLTLNQLRWYYNMRALTVRPENGGSQEGDR